MKKFIIAPIIFALIAAIFIYWRYSVAHPSTDDAYIKANIAHISSQVSGQVNKINIYNHEQVKKGQLLFSLDPKQFKIAVAKAQAQLTLAKQHIKAMTATIASQKALIHEREAELTLAKKNAKRTLTLVAAGQSSLANKDDVQSKLAVAKSALQVAKEQLQQTKDELGKQGDLNAQIRQAEAQLAQAQLDLQHTQIFAPATGTIDQFSLRPGDTIDAMQAQFVIIEKKQWWLDANFKETDLARIHPGQPVNITIDMYPGTTFHGTVASISKGSGASFSLLPPENATGNWVKVTQRFPVKIVFTQSLPTNKPLRIGASAVVTIDTTKA